MAKSHTIIAVVDQVMFKFGAETGKLETVRWLVGSARLYICGPHNYRMLDSTDLYLVFGAVQNELKLSETVGSRTIFLPAIEDPKWTHSALSFARRLIQEGNADLELHFVNGCLRAETLCPF